MGDYIDHLKIVPEQPVFNKSGMHQINVHSGCKAFDRQVVCLTVGNVWDNAYYGNYISPSYCTDRNNMMWQPGHLLNYDLKGFKIGGKDRVTMIDFIDKNNGGILYEFWHIYRPKEYYPGPRRRVARIYPPTHWTHGWLLTDRSFKYLHHVQANFGQYQKDWNVLWACMQFLCDEKSLRKHFGQVRKDGLE